jgi:ribosomal protein L29
MKKQLPKNIKIFSKLDANELAKEILRAEKELFLLNLKHRSNELKQSHTLGLQKKYLASLQMIKTNL